MSQSLTGAVIVARVSLRQDARRILPWIGAISALSASSVLAYSWVFTSPADRMQLANSLGANPALSLVFGPARDLTTADGFNAWRAGQLGALFAGLMTILIVVRNSRAQEDSGLAELLASSVLARRSRLAAAVLLASAASVALGLVCFGLTLASGGGLASTAVLSATFAAAGLMFAGVGAVAAQLGADARQASSLALGLLGVGYLLRGYLDSSGAPSWTLWLTPFSWLERTHPGSGNDPLPLLAAVAFAAALVLLGFWLEGRRDFGQGLVADRPGPAHARLAATVWGLAVRLNQGVLIAWGIAFIGLGLVFGALVSALGGLVADNPALSGILAAGGLHSSDLTFAFIATMLQIIAIIVAVMGVQVVMRVYTEELEQRVEPLLAGSLRRTTYLASNVVIALLGTACAQFLGGAALGLVASTTDHSVSLAKVITQSLVTIPAIWALVALGIAAVGALPAARGIAWLGVVATFALTLLGPTFKLPDWALSISPLRHVPTVTADAPGWGGLGWLALVSVALLVIGFVGYRRRSIL